MFTLFSFIFMVASFVMLGLSIYNFKQFVKAKNDPYERVNPGSKVRIGTFLLVLTLLFFVMGIILQKSFIVPALHTGYVKNSLTQEISQVKTVGISNKPFLASYHIFPNSPKHENCTDYNVAAKGGIGITVSLCTYINASFDWLSEMQKTGHVDYNPIREVWKKETTGLIAKTIKDKSPSQLSDERFQIESDFFTAIQPWYNERGIDLITVSFPSWDFTSEKVAVEYDKSIQSQTRIAQEQNLLEAAGIAKEREILEAETDLEVADIQLETMELLGLDPETFIDFLWVKLVEEGHKPDVLILDTSAGKGNIPVSIPLDPGATQDTDSTPIVTVTLTTTQGTD